MKATIITNSASLLDSMKELSDWADEISMAFAWASTLEGKAEHWCALDLDKVKQAVIGTQFAQTEPWVLSALDEVPGRLRVSISSDGTFHPKVILGTKGREVRALLGSANFTTAAYTTNAEVSVLLDGQSHDPQFQHLQAWIQEQFDDSEQLDPDWLVAYTKVWETERRRKVVVPRAKLELTSLSSLAMSWDDYYATIRAQEKRKLSSGTVLQVNGPYPSYEVELDRAGAIFKGGKPFADLPDDQRKMLIGVGPRSSGLLGTMNAAGYAKEIVNKSPEKIGAALDRIPIEGAVSLRLASEVVDAMTSLRGIKIGVASRLLAVKRPDLFVSVNNGSKPQLAQLFGGRVVRTGKHYINLLKLVWETDWHRAVRPADVDQAAVWDRRAALLDAALYEEV